MAGRSTAKFRAAVYYNVVTRGMTSSADGKWVHDSKGWDRPFREKAAANQARNRRNAEKRGRRKGLKWEAAVERARATLIASGDKSEPLPSFVSKFL